MCACVSPVQVEFAGQHPPVVASGLRSVQTAAQFLPDGQRDAEGVGSHQGGDVAGGVHQGRVYALDLLVGQREKKLFQEKFQGSFNTEKYFSILTEQLQILP